MSTKKSETIEVRLSYETKAAFMARCRAERRSASDAIRQFIEARPDTAAGSRVARTAALRPIMAGLVGALLGLGAAAPSLARSTETSRQSFDRLDRNHDGMISYGEYRSR